MFSIRRLIAFVCLVAVLLAAMVPSASGPLPACLVAIFLFVAVVVIVQPGRRAETTDLPFQPFLATVSLRAPPLA